MPVQRDKTLECKSCHGHLVPDRYVDTEDEGGHMWIRMLRCVGCGRTANVASPGTNRLRVSTFINRTSGYTLADESTPLGI